MGKIRVFGTGILTGLAFFVFASTGLAGGSFFIDDVTSFVGIGNTMPQSRLDVSGTIYSRLVTASSTTINWNQGNVQTMTLTSNPTFTFSNGQAGGEYKLILAQDGTGSRTVIWPASVKWAGGIVPTLTSAASSIDSLSFIFDGTNYLGSYNLNYGNTNSLLTGLVSFWDFDESSGNAADASPGGNTLTNHNSTTYVSGKINNASNLQSGNSNYFSSTASDLDFSGAQDLSISLWFYKASDFSGANPGLVGKFNTSSDQRSYLLNLNNPGGMGDHDFLVWRVSDDGTSPPVGSWDLGSNLSTGAWYNIIMTYDASAGSAEAWINGASLGVITGLDTSIYNSTAVFEVGSNMNGVLNYVDGKIDMLGIWDRQLTSGEVSSLYNGGSGIQYPF